MRVFVKDFGCKVNQVEGEYIRNLVVSGGGVITDNLLDADIVLINTCAVTSRAGQKIFQFARGVRARLPQAKIILLGCLATMFERMGLTENALFDNIVPQNMKLKFVRDNFGSVLEPDDWASADRFFEHTRAFIKIQDGCEHFCSYCIVPFVRGKEISRPVESIFEQVSKIVERGFKEIVLVGVRIGNWKGVIDGKDSDLAGLLRLIVERFPNLRIRLTSVEPWEITDELIELIANSGNIARHLHIPLQSASDKILRLMRRPYTISDYRRICERIVEKVDDIAIGTDIIVGFPGEDESDFRMTYSFVERFPFAYIHIFRYSERPFTSASNFEMQIPGEIKSARLRELKALAKHKRECFIERFLNRELDVIVERRKGALWSSHSSNYILCLISSTDDIYGKRLLVRGLARKDNALLCELVR